MYKSDKERREYHRRYNKEYYRLNKEKEKERVRSRRRELMNWYKDYKKSLKCELCGENHPFCLEFHHNYPNKKYQEISYLYKCSRTKFLSELKKCTVLCANCHRKVHATNGDMGLKNSKLFKKGPSNCFNCSPVV